MQDIFNYKAKSKQYGMYHLCMFTFFFFLICNILQKLSEDKQSGGQWKGRAIVIIITYLLGFFIFLIAFQVAQW